jgi:hypothetical protein
MDGVGSFDTRVLESLGEVADLVGTLLEPGGMVGFAE